MISAKLGGQTANQEYEIHGEPGGTRDRDGVFHRITY
jgi:hypothetical protein